MARALGLRLAMPEDSGRVLAWRNDPWLVSLSTSRRTVTEEEHRAWFPRALERDRCLLFVADEAGEEMGTVRLDRAPDGASAFITIYLLKAFTGRGHGKAALRSATGEAFGRWPTLAKIIAHVRDDNHPSRRAFEGAGFTIDAGEPAPEGHVACVLPRERT